MILLDTNVVSELLKPAPARPVVSWINNRFAECAISSITVFELHLGIAKQAEGKRRDVFSESVTRLLRRFGPRVYAYDTPAALASARLFEHARRLGLGLHQVPANVLDLQLAGIALAYGMEFATRNISDFQGVGLTLINPWESAP